jgi:hypothetical protein
METTSIPGVVSVTPTQGASSVAVGTTISATFSQAMDPASITAAGTFTVTGPGGAVAGSVTYSGMVATFTLTPGTTLAYGATYTATITTAAATPGGAELVNNYVWTFSTSAASILSVAVTPAQGAHVFVSAPITATFNLAMNCTTLQSPATTFTLTDSSGIVPGAVTCAGSVATFVPTGGVLPAYDTYTATITTGATSSAEGVSLPANYVWTFTATPPLTAAPTVTATDPVTPNPSASPAVPEDVNVPLNEVITATFSEAMNPNTINSANFALKVTTGGAGVSGTVGYLPSTNQLVFVPSAGSVPVNLLPDTEYTATITGGASGVTDLYGTGMTALTYTWQFHTVAGTSVIAPELVSSVPGDTAVGVPAVNVPLNQAVSATFSEGMNTQTLRADFLVYATLDSTKTPIAGSLRYSPSTFIATFTPTLPFAVSTSYTATVVGATDLFGNVLGNSPTAPYTNTWTFTTGTTLVVPPVVLGPTIAAFGGFGGNAGMTNAGNLTVIHGDIGTTLYSESMTGFYDNNYMNGAVPGCNYTAGIGANYGLVIGSIDTAPGTSFSNVQCPIEATAATGAIATEALGEAQTAYNTLAALPAGLNVSACCGASTPDELGGLILLPGTYTSTVGSYKITTGNLTLDAQGDPSAYWVFQMPSSLTVGLAATPVSVILKNGALASHVFWVVENLPGAVINPSGGGIFVGTVISQYGIAISTSGLPATVANIVTIDGRVIALTASTTMSNTIINTPPPQ